MKTRTLAALNALLAAAEKVHASATHKAPIARNMARLSLLIERCERSERRAMGWR